MEKIIIFAKELKNFHGKNAKNYTRFLYVRIELKIKSMQKKNHIENKNYEIFASKKKILFLINNSNEIFRIKLDNKY